MVVLPRRWKGLHSQLVGLMVVGAIFFLTRPHRENALRRTEKDQHKFRQKRTVNKKMPLLLHLDLKGAPPTISYFERFLPFARGLGVDGLLIEYEDTFPFDGRLSVLRSSTFAYTKEEIKRLLELASSLGMEVIPLVQTFGHLEFVLKHADFAYLREQPASDWSLCPLREGSITLLAEMIDQVGLA